MKFVIRIEGIPTAFAALLYKYGSEREKKLFYNAVHRTMLDMLHH